MSCRSERLRRRTSRRNAIAVSVTAVIVLASLLWILSVAFFQVSSNSMAPALRGGPGPRDRLVCWKLGYLLRQPRRWEMAVFRAPANAVDREVLPGLRTGGESGITVKRIAGLPGERLALAGGDVWSRPLGEDGPFGRRFKPDSVQRGMWIPVYAEDFADLTADEFLYYWRREGDGEIRVGPDRALSLLPGGGGLGIHYRPVAPVAMANRTAEERARIIAELPGIPDRYVLEQKVQFKCPNPDCGAEFEAAVDSQKIQARCPACRLLVHEESVVFYEFRSGLPETGPYAVGYTADNQGDQNHVRLQNYHFVFDFRVAFEARLASSGSFCRVRLSGAEREATAVLGGGRAAVTVDGREVAAVPLPSGEWLRVEFQRLDGAVRLFLGRERREAVDLAAWEEEKPDADWRAGESGVAIRADGGGVAIRNLAIDRDIYYFGSSRHGGGGFVRHMDANGEVGVEEGRFLPLGDNTTVSLDGRSWGPVDLSLLRGRAVAIWSPKERRGWIPAP